MSVLSTRIYCSYPIFKLFVLIDNFKCINVNMYIPNAYWYTYHCHFIEDTIYIMARKRGFNSDTVKKNPSFKTEAAVIFAILQKFTNFIILSLFRLWLAFFQWFELHISFLPKLPFKLLTKNYYNQPYRFYTNDSDIWTTQI